MPVPKWIKMISLYPRNNIACISGFFKIKYRNPNYKKTNNYLYRTEVLWTEWRNQRFSFWGGLTTLIQRIMLFKTLLLTNFHWLGFHFNWSFLSMDCRSSWDLYLLWQCHTVVSGTSMISRSDFGLLSRDFKLQKWLVSS